MKAEQAGQAVAAGARFLVSPVMAPAVIARAHELGALAVPGVSTSGVTADNAAAFLRAGAFALGFVAPLFDPEALAREDYAAIEARAHRLLQQVKTCFHRPASESAATRRLPCRR